ncbi:MAG: hypothetical protein QOD10_5712 [Mycobacterium sp.]|jgi:hypothetical protein|nr:hypothetical protein [Mycobacterium sp.]
MRTLARLGTCTAAITVAISPVTPFGIVRAAAEGDTRVALLSDLRRCDFSLAATAPSEYRPIMGSGSAVIHIAGSRAIAEVHLFDGSSPGTHFDVGLIQEPRPSSATCGPGDPGTAFTGMDTDGAGSGTATVQDAIRPGTTGVWVIVERPNGFSQNPAEYYTSEFVAPV